MGTSILPQPTPFHALHPGKERTRLLRPFLIALGERFKQISQLRRSANYIPHSGSSLFTSHMDKETKKGTKSTSQEGKISLMNDELK